MGAINMIVVQERVTPTKDKVNLELSWRQRIEKSIGLDLLMFHGQTFLPKQCRRIFNCFISQGFSLSYRTICRRTIVLKKPVGDGSGRQYVVWLGYELLQDDDRVGYFECGVVQGQQRDPADWTPLHAVIR